MQKMLVLGLVEKVTEKGTGFVPAVALDGVIYEIGETVYRTQEGATKTLATELGRLLDGDFPDRREMDDSIEEQLDKLDVQLTRG